MEILENNISPEIEKLRQEIEAYGKFKGWDAFQIHEAFIEKLDERKAKEEQENKVIELPAEAKGNRAVPNACIRSALFGVVKRGKRKHLISEVISAQKEYEISFTGQRLDQTDFDVWLAIKHLCSPYPLGKEVRFSAIELLVVLRRKDGKSTREWLLRSIQRMTDCKVRMKMDHRGFIGNMIDYCSWDEHKYIFTVLLSKKMAPLFEDRAYTLLNAEERQHLHKDLTRWMHSYWSSHNDIYPIKDTTLHKLCGSEASKDRFRRDLRDALKELERIGFIKKGFRVDKKGLVTADKIERKKITQESQGG